MGNAYAMVFPLAGMRRKCVVYERQELERHAEVV